MGVTATSQPAKSFFPNINPLQPKWARASPTFSGREEVVSLQALAGRYQSLIVAAIKSWATRQDNQGDLGRAEMRLLNWLVEKGPLDSMGSEPPGSASDRLQALLQEYKQVEATLPEPRRVLAMADGYRD